jgi:hypothetical protein
MPKRRAMWIRVDGRKIRFALDRKTGLHVRHGRRRKDKIVTFQDLSDLATGQIKMNLV